MKNALKGLKTSEFYSPGSIFHVELTPSRGFGPDQGRPVKEDVVIGMPDEFSAWFDNSQAFELIPPGPNAGPEADPGRVLASYARLNTLDSGWLLGPEKVRGKAALVQFSQERGRIILFGFSPHHRGQPHGTFRLLFNALYPIERLDVR